MLLTFVKDEKSKNFRKQLKKTAKLFNIDWIKKDFRFISLIVL